MFKFEHVPWLDDKGHVRPPLMLYLLLAFLGRGWLVFIASLTQADDRTGLVRLFYPLKDDFLLALLTGLGAVLLYLLVIAERKRAWRWPIAVFRRMKWGLWFLLALDGMLLGQRLLHSDFMFSPTAAFDALMLFWGALYLLKSLHLKLYLKDWQANAED
nr:DUF2919 domain-containing protein [Shewanella sedimentimangrovi]